MCDVITDPYPHSQSAASTVGPTPCLWMLFWIIGEQLYR